MARLLHKTWQAAGATGLPRRHRKPCNYAAYVPDMLRERRIRLDGDVAAEVAEAEAAVARLDEGASVLVNTEVLARLLLRAESVASSRIEGLEIGGRRLLQAEAARGMGQSVDFTAKEVLGNVDAMAWASEAAPPAISTDHMLEIHRRLFLGNRLEAQAGRLRTDQNWIGGSDYNPCSAVFVPPPPEMVPGLLEDLCDFCNDDSLPTIAQAALAHAQFETIHPFADGNGRTGRVLIHLVLQRRGLARRVLPPVSLVLATWSRDYVDALMTTRYEGPEESQSAHDGLNNWVALFAAACKRAVSDAEDFERRARDLQQGWRRRAGPVRARSALDLLIERLPGAPVITVGAAAQLIGRSFQATNGAVARLAETGILAPVTIGRRNRAFEASEVIQEFTRLERQLASPVGDTRRSAPSRRVPRR
ncbi:MAG: Fic family protein [Dehalococcoidia bacterium]|nr:Fic family protein [Dehalococcoidia bacterium]